MCLGATLSSTQRLYICGVKVTESCIVAVQDYVAQGAAAKLPKLALAEDVFASLEAMAAKQGKSISHLASETLRSSLCT